MRGSPFSGLRSGRPLSHLPVFRLAAALVAACFIAPLQAADPTYLYWPDGDGSSDNDSYFGRDVDFDGELMVIAAPNTAAAAYVFRYAGSAWQHAATLAVPADASAYGEMALAVDGDVIAIGSPGAAVDGIAGAGLVYIFERAAADSWALVTQFASDVPVTDGGFGRNVVFEDGRILVGGWSPADPAGYLFERDASGEWALAQKFAGADGSGLVVDGVAIDGDRIAFAHDDTGAYVYERTAAGWVLDDFLPIDTAHSVALEGDVLVVGSPYESIGELPRMEGIARVFEYTGGDWQQVARLHSPQGDALGYFGTRLDMQDGLLAVGEGHETGAVYAFRKNETGEWTNFGGYYDGSQHGTIHVPAMCARTLAVGFSRQGMSRVLLFDVAQLMAEAGGGDGSDDENTVGDGSRDGNTADDEPAGSGGDDAYGDDAGGNGTDNDATGAGSGDGNANGGDGDGTSDDVTPSLTARGANESGGGGGGGAAGWLLGLLFVLSKLAGLRRRRWQVH